MPTQIEAFYPHVTVHVPQCSDPLIEQAVRDACIEFCQRTHIWKVRTEPDTFTSSDFPYVFPLQEGGQVFQVESVRIAGLKPLKPFSEQILDGKEWVDWRTETGTPVYYLMDSESQMTVYPLPDSEINLSATVLCQPTRTANSVPTDLYRNHAESIAAGALARLFAIPQQAWYSPDVAMYYRNAFNAACDDLRSKVQLGLNESSPRAKAYFL